MSSQIRNITAGVTLLTLSDYQLAINISGGAAQIYLPSVQDWLTYQEKSGNQVGLKAITFSDIANLCATNNITLYAANGDNINTVSSYVVNLNGASGMLFPNPNGNSWSLFLDLEAAPTPPPPPTVINNKNFIQVDPVYGNDTTAVSNGIYNPNHPFLTVESAIANASVGDLIVCIKGTHNLSSTIVNPQVDFYLYPDAILNCSGGVFSKTDGGTLNIYGEGQLVGGGFAVPVILVNSSSVLNITANKITHSSSFYGAIYAESLAVVNANVKEIDCSFNLANAIVADTGAKVYLTANVVKFSWVGYIVGDSSEVIANVERTICYNIAGDFTTLGNSYVLIANGALNAKATVNGDLFTAQTEDSPTGAGGGLNFQNGAGGTIILNGTKSIVRQQNPIRISNCPSGNIIVLSEIQNIQDGGTGFSGRGAYLNSGKLTLKSKLSNSTNDSLVQYDGGTLILDDAVLIATAGATESIATAAAPITMKVYSGYTNKAINVGISNSIVGTSLIVDAGVE